MTDHDDGLERPITVGDVLTFVVGYYVIGPLVMLVLWLIWNAA